MSGGEERRRLKCVKRRCESEEEPVVELRLAQTPYFFVEVLLDKFDNRSAISFGFNVVPSLTRLIYGLCTWAFTRFDLNASEYGLRPRPICFGLFYYLFEDESICR